MPILSGGGSAGRTRRVRRAPTLSVAETARINQRTNLIATNLPGLDLAPNEMHALVRSNFSDDQLIAHVNDLSSNLTLESLARNLNASDDAVQRARYALLHPTQQSALEQYGYAPPDPNKGGGGFFSNIDVPFSGKFESALNFSLRNLDPTGTIEHGPFDERNANIGGPSGLVALMPQFAIPTALKFGLTQAFHGFEALERNSSHLYRTARWYQDQFVEQDKGLGGAGALLSPFGGALVGGGIGLRGFGGWGETSDGEEYFIESAQLEASELLGADVSNFENQQSDLWLARKIAGGHTAAEMAEEMGLTELDALWNETVVNLWERSHDDKILEAVEILNRGKVSFGRDLAGEMGLRDPSNPLNRIVEKVTRAPVIGAFLPDMDLQTLVSGTGDAAFVVLADPTNFVGGAFVKARHASRWGFDGNNLRSLELQHGFAQAWRWVDDAPADEVRSMEQLLDIWAGMDDGFVFADEIFEGAGQAGFRMAKSTFGPVNRMGQRIIRNNARNVNRFIDRTTGVMELHRQHLDEAIELRSARQAGNLEEHQLDALESAVIEADALKKRAAAQLFHDKPELMTMWDAMLQAESINYTNDLVKAGHITLEEVADEGFVAVADEVWTLNAMDFVTPPTSESLRTSTGMWDWVLSTEGREAIFRGEATGFLPSTPFMPRITGFDETRASIRATGRRVLDPGDTRGFLHRAFDSGEFDESFIGEFGPLIDEIILRSDGLTGDELAKELAAIKSEKPFDKLFNFYKRTNTGALERKATEAGYERLGRLIGVPGAAIRHQRNFARSLFHHVPRSNRLYTNGEEAIQEFRRLTEMGALSHLPQHLMDEYVGAFAFGNKGQRIGASLSFTSDVMARAGLFEHGIMSSEVWQRFVAHTRQAYSINQYGVDSTMIEGVHTRSAAWLGEHSSAFLMPDFRAMAKATRQVNMHRRIFGRISDNYLDAQMTRIWKPAVLMRLGFAPRAGGEEAIAFLVREGPIKYAQAKFSLGAADFRLTRAGEIRNVDELHELTLMRPLNWLSYQLDYAFGLADNALVSKEFDKVLAAQDFGKLTQDEITQRVMAGVKKTREQARGGRRAVNSFNEIITKTNLRAGNRLHEMTRTRTWIPTKPEIAKWARQTLGAKPQEGRFSLDNMGEEHVANLMFTHPIYQGRMADIGAATFDPWRNAGDVQHAVADPFRSALDNRMRHISYTHAPSDMVHYTQDDLREFLIAYSQGVQRVVSDPVGRVGMNEVLHFASPLAQRQLDDTLRTVGSRMFAGLDPQERFVAIHKQIRRDVDEGTLAALHRWARDGDNTQDVNRMLRQIDSDETRALVTDIIARADRIDRRPLISVFSPRVNADEFVFTKEAFQQRLEQRMRVALHQQRGQRHVQESVRAVVGPTGKLDNGIPPGKARFYAPAIDAADYHFLAGIPYDDHQLAQLAEEMTQAVLTRIPMYRNPGELNMQIQRLLVRMANPTDEGMWALAAEQAAKQGGRMPLGFLAHRDPKIAEAMSDALDDALFQARRALGETDEAHIIARRSKSYAYYDLGEHAPEQLGSGRFRDLDDVGDFVPMEATLSIHGRPIDPENAHTLTEVKRPGRDAEWMTEDAIKAEYRDEVIFVDDGVDRLTGNPKQRSETVNKLPDDFEQGRQIISNGMPLEDGLDTLAATMADSMIEMLTTKYATNGDINDFSALTEVADSALSGGDELVGVHLGVNVPYEDMPKTMWGPRQVVDSDIWWDKLVRYNFDVVAAPVIKAMARSPLFHRNASAAMEQTRFIFNEMRDPALASKMDDVLNMGRHVDDDRELIDTIIAQMWDQANYSDDALEDIHYLKELEFELHKVRTLKDPEATIDEVREAFMDLGIVMADSSDVAAVEFALAAAKEDPEAIIKPFNRLGMDFDEFQKVRRGTPVDLGDGKTLSGRLGVRETMEKMGVRFADNSEVKALRNAMVDRRAAFAQWQEATAKRALNLTVPFIDDHRIRSQWQQWMSSMVPFWFAEEQFLKRWARGFYQTPHQLRRAQFAMNGFREMGVIRQNENGDDIFVYPMSEHVADNFVMKGMMRLRFGEGFGQVTSNPITARTEYMFPGLNSNPGQIQWGPLPAIALAKVANRFPEFRDATDAILGETAANRFDFDTSAGGFIESLLPASVSQIMRQWTVNNFDEGQLRSAEMQAIQYLAASGHSPPPDASTGEMEEFLARVDNTARIVLAMRSLSAFTVGASGRPLLEGNIELADEFREIMFESGLDYEEALAAFLEVYPDAHAYSVFRTGSVSGARIPTNEDSLAFMETNKGFIEQFPMAAPWFLPQGDNDYDSTNGRRARNFALTNELRLQRTPEEFLDQMYFAQGAESYFDQLESYRIARESQRLAGNTTNVRTLDEMWTEWTRAYKIQHPTFTAQLEEGAGQKRRNDIVSQLRQILADPASIPDIEGSSGIIAMAQLTVQYDSFLESIRGASGAQSTRTREQAAVRFYTLAEGLVNEDPGLQVYFNAVVRPMIGESNLIKLIVRGNI